MKKSILITVIVALISVIGMNAQEGMDTFEVQVDGLGCPFCAYGLEKKFKEFKGIKKVEIEIETGNFSFIYPSEKELSLAQVEKQVEKAGYTPITTKITRADGTVENSGTKVSVADDADLAEKSVKVFGNCGMCEARIIKAANSVNGVANASWDKETKMLKVNYDIDQTSLSEIEMAIAKVGHDTANHEAKTDIYEDLPGCCKYERENQ